MVILENIDIDINIDKEILETIDIDKILNRLEFGISNRAMSDTFYISLWVEFGGLCYSAIPPKSPPPPPPNPTQPTQSLICDK